MQKRVIASAIILIGLVVTVSAAVVLFTQSFTSVPVVGANVVAGCQSVTPTPTAIVRNVGEDASYILFNCNGQKAFDVARSSSPTPVFNLGQGYKNITAVVHNSIVPTSGPPCNPSSVGGTTLTTGTTTSMTANPYDYCVGYDITTLSGSQSLGSFSLTWQQ